MVAILITTCFAICCKGEGNQEQNNQEATENIPLLEQNSLNAIEILHGYHHSHGYTYDKIAIKKLIRAESSENIQLKQILRMINMKGMGSQDLTTRRRVNKCFMDCLVDVQRGNPAALVWLKKHIDFQICKTMLSDWKHSGRMLKVLEKSCIALKKYIYHTRAIIMYIVYFLPHFQRPFLRF